MEVAAVEWHRDRLRGEQASTWNQPRAGTVLLDDQKGTAVRHPGRRAAAEVSVGRGQREVGRVKGGVSAVAAEDPPVPATRQVDLDPVSAQFHVTTPTAATPTNASCAISVQRRTGR